MTPKAAAMRIRPATWADLSDLTWVLIGASPSDPIYPYRFPRRDIYPEDFEVHCRIKCVEYLDNCDVIVYETASVEDPDKFKVVAFSVWDIPLSSKPSRQPEPVIDSAESTPRSSMDSDTPPRRDAHPGRMTAFRDECTTAKTKFFDSRYRGGHVFLKVLLCHPDYRRRGAGRALTSWGIARARRHGVHTTLFSSPMGLPLYRKLGFREVGHFRVQLPGDDAFLQIPALVLAPARIALPSAVEVS